MTDTLSIPAFRTVARVGAPSSYWVRGPVWDAVFMQNALWLLPLVLWLAYGRADPSRGPLDLLFFGITALFWIGHRFGSTWLVYATEAYRPLLKAQPFRFIAIPLLVAALCFAILLPADAALPWTRAQRVIALAIVDYVFSTWHFGAQHFGALSLYRSRAGRSASRTTRRRDRLFALGAGGVLIVIADMLAGSIAYPQQWLGPLPAWFAAEQDPIRFVATALLIAATAAMLVSELRAERISLPRILYVTGLAAMVGVALQPRSLFVFLAIWTSQHWILATGIGAQAPSCEPAPAQGMFRRALHALNTRPWMLIVFLMLVSVILLPLFEVEANWQTPGAAWYGDRIFGALAAGLRSSTFVPALLALGFAAGFTHYLLDRAAYRFSDPKVRKAASALVLPRAGGTPVPAEPGMS
jgi:hypothetical protein